MTTTKTPVQAWGGIHTNVVSLELSVTTAVCEGMNVALASFQALYLQ